MVPMAGQDPVLDGTTFQWETHMRAAIIKREHLSAFMHQQYRAVVAANNQPPLCFQLLRVPARTKSEIMSAIGASPNRIRRNAIHMRPGSGVNSRSANL